LLGLPFDTEAASSMFLRKAVDFYLLNGVTSQKIIFFIVKHHERLGE
jgi:hypothetical protein